MAGLIQGLADSIQRLAGLIQGLDGSIQGKCLPGIREIFRISFCVDRCNAMLDA